MMPMTPHMVLGMSSSIVFGRHFYAIGTIRRSCLGIIHALILGSGIANTFHEDDIRSLFRQIMGALYRHFILRDGFARELSFLFPISCSYPFLDVAPHIPDMREEEGLLDVIVLGCVLEFATALNRFCYTQSYNPDDEDTIKDMEQEHLSRTFFRAIMKAFGSRYTLTLDRALVHPTHLWQSIMVRFAVVIVGYMKAKAKEVRKEPGFTPKALEKQLRLHFQTDHPHLLPAFNAALDDSPRPCELIWDGPTIKVIQRTAAFESFLRAAGGLEFRTHYNWPLCRDDLFLKFQPVNKFYEDDWPHEDSDSDSATG